MHKEWDCAVSWVLSGCRMRIMWYGLEIGGGDCWVVVMRITMERGIVGAMHEAGFDREKWDLGCLGGGRVSDVHGKQGWLYS